MYVTYTCAHAHARTHTQTHRHTHTETLAQMPHRRSPSRTRTLSLCCCEIKAWKAGHKGDCVAAARADRTSLARRSPPTTTQPAPTFARSSRPLRSSLRRLTTSLLAIFGRQHGGRKEDLSGAESKKVDKAKSSKSKGKPPSTEGADP